MSIMTSHLQKNPQHFSGTLAIEFDGFSREKVGIIF
ncbi:hypothetical protein BPC006_II2031 [Burkholderia pseudomallei BPC006]|nr:hypothetical protein BPC006_II2031 [Burkholderia pseudomallei BPC006]